MNPTKKVKIRSIEKIKVLIADDDGQNARRMHDFLQHNGFDCRMAADGIEARSIMLKWKPKVVLADLLLPSGNAFTLLQNAKTEVSLRAEPPKIIVLSGHNSPDNVHQAFSHGASDYLARPIMFNDLLARMVFHCRQTREIEPSAAKKNSTQMDIENFLTAALENQELSIGLYEQAHQLAIKVRAARVSIIQGVTFEVGRVVASSDKKNINGLELDLKKYPEVQLVINSGKSIVIDNIDESKSLKAIRTRLRDVQFNAMVVCPIHLRGKVYGCISVRLQEEKEKIADSDLQFVRCVAKIIGLYLGALPMDQVAKFGLVSA
jgi:DNA-binding response OmpR family regulator